MMKTDRVAPGGVCGRVTCYVTVIYSVRQIISVVIVRKWVICIYIRIEHIMARPNHHKSCPDDKSRVSPMRCHVRAGVLDDLDVFIVSVCRAWRNGAHHIFSDRAHQGASESLPIMS